MMNAWLRNHPDKDVRKKQVQGWKPAFEEIKEILERDYKKKDSCRDYDSPGWANKQIAVNEYNQAIDDLMKLLTL